MKLLLKSNITKKSWCFSVEDNGDSKLYYHFPKFKLNEKMDDGEYDYELYDDNELVAQGLLQIGDYKNNNVTIYTKENGNGFKQYQG